MSIVNQPDNTNFLSPLGFKFSIPKYPNFNYFVQSVNFPRLELNGTKDVQTPFNKIMLAGDHLTFGELSVIFKIDEDMYSYFEFVDWIVGIGKPESFSQYAAQVSSTGKGIEVNGDLLILNNVLNPIIKVTFEDLIPQNISGVVFDSTSEDVSYITATVTFKYRQYTYTRL